MTLPVALLATLVSHVMVNITRPLLGLFASDLGAGMLMIGFLASSYALLPLLLAMQVGHLADRLGNRLPVVLGVSGVSVGLLLPFLVPTLWGLLVSQLLVGLAHTVAMVALQNVIGGTSTFETRDQRFGWFATATSSGALLGPVIGGYLSQYFSYPAAFLGASLVGVLAIAAAWLLPVGSRHRSPKGYRSGAVELFRIPALRRALFISGLVLYSRDIFVVYFPLFGAEEGLSNSTIGWIIGAQGLAIILVRVFLGRVSLLIGRERLLTLSVALAGLAFALIPFTEVVLWLGLLSALMGLGLGCGQPLSMSTTFDASPVGRTGEALGLRMGINRLSQLVAPPVFGALAASMGLLAVFFASSGLLFAGAFFSRNRRRDQESEPQSLRSREQRTERDYE